ncbi:MAG: cadherin-like domain-containing protein [Kordiimonadaceae bacterium]|nr:cadherin-like domain-containing protein [Kordiimonadaceae bacterium]
MSDSDQKQSLSTTVSSTASADTISQKPKNKKLKQIGILMSLLPLAACGGSSGGGGENPDDTPDPAPPAPTPTPDFTENPTNVFIAVDSSDSVLSKASATADLTVTGKGGNDTISTGSGDDIVDGGSGDDIISTGAGDDIVKGGPDNDTISTGTGADLIRGGNGIDAINAGADNDAIVVVGTTSANQYVQADITNPAGSGTDLSALITLADLNGRGVSEVGSGETIDGGTGTNTLFIYGTVDLTGVTLTNVTVLVVNSDVTLTAAQMAQFTTVDGDGSSVINIEVPPGDNYIIDLSSLNITDIGNLNIDGDVTFIIDDATDLAEIGAINTGSTADVKVQINGNGGSTNVNLGDIAAKINNATTIDLAPTVTLQVDDADDITNLGLSEISGSGNIDTGGNNDIDDALNNNVDVVANSAPVAVSDTAATDENSPVTFDVLANDTDKNSDALAITGANITNGSGTVSIVNNELVYDPDGTYAHLNAGQSADVLIDYEISDGNGGVDTATLTVTVNGATNIINGTDASETLNGTDADDIINGGSGNDIITGGDGDDLIYGGKDMDTVDGGQGNDHIVVIGTTTEGQYDASAITNPGGSGFDLSSLISLDDLNGHLISDAVNGETIDGGAGDNTLYIYGNTDLTGVSISNITNLVVNSDVTLTVSQILQFTNIDGDGNSVLNIVVPDDANNYILDLTKINLTDIAEIHVSGDLTFVIDDATDFSGIQNISAEAGSEIYLEINQQQPMSVITLDEIATVFDQVIVVDYEGDGYVYPMIYNAGGNFETDAQSGFISEIAQNYDYSPRLYLYGDQSGNETWTLDLTGYDLSGIGRIYLSENGVEEITFNDQNIQDWDDSSSISSRLFIYGGQTDILNTGSDDWTFEISQINSEGLKYIYRNGNDFIYIDSALAKANGFTIPDGFIETEPNQFLADENNLEPTLDQSLSDQNLTVTGNDGQYIWISTGSGDDHITIGDQQIMSYVYAGAGNDFITGGSGRDTVRAKEGDDIILAGGGNDRIYGGDGADYMDGGDGTQDQINYYQSPEAVYINLETSVVYGGFADGDTILNIEDVIGSAFNDTIIGDANDNGLYGGDAGFELIYGGAGNDEIRGMGQLYGEAGNDSFDINQREDHSNTVIDGGTGIDVVNFYVDYNDGQPNSWDPFPTSMSLENIEIFRVRSNGENAETNIDISAQDVIDFTDDNNALYITTFNSNYLDTITVSTDSTWTYIDEVEYSFTDHDGQYSSYYLQYESNGATIYIDTRIENQTGFPVPNTNYTETSTNVFVAPDDIDGYFRYGDSTDNLTVTGKAQNDEIITGIGDDIIDAGDGSNSLISGAGNDTITVAGSGDTFINSGDNADTINVTNGYNQIYGGSGNDTINVSGGSNTISGEDGDDIITATGGYNYIEGGAGADTLVGNAGTLIYTNSPEGITINLKTGIGSGGDAEGDIVSNFSTVNGSAFDDHITGDDASNHFEGGDGDDTIFGEGGDDTFYADPGADILDGGDHDSSGDTVVYQFSGEAVIVNLDAGTFSGGDAEGDQLTNIENIYGSSYDDQLTGDANNNILNGVGGNNIINGLGGDDTLISGGGADILSGGTGNDTFLFSYNGYFEPYAGLTGQIDGGDDYDIFSLFNYSLDTVEINFSNLNATNMEELAITSGANELTFTAQNIIDITDGNNIFAISGDGISGITTSDTWTYDSLVVNENGAFYAYTSGAATLNVAVDIAADLGFNTLVTSNFTETSPNMYEADDDTNSIYVQSDVYTGTHITGKGGNDTIITYGITSHYFWGGEGDDTIIGGIYADEFYGDAGADTYYGGGGSNTLRYADSSSGVTLDFVSGTGTGGDAEGDTFYNFWAAYGSDYDDNITGDDSANYFDGGTGSDSIHGGGGNDGIEGGDDNDTLYGDDGNDFINGGAGNDTIYGGDGSDTIATDTGDDLIDAGNGNDTIYFSPNDINDIIDGSNGSDTLIFSGIPGGFHFDLSTISASNIEEVNLNSNSYLTLTIQDILDVTDSDNTLIIDGSPILLDSTGEGWVQGADQVIDSNTYHTYTAGGATLLIDDDITQLIS